jgi:hypothetical protein
LSKYYCKYQQGAESICLSLSARFQVDYELDYFYLSILID